MVLADHTTFENVHPSLRCENVDGRCTNGLHPGRNQIGPDKLCRIGRAWSKTARPCAGCGAPIPAHLAFTKNARAGKGLPRPKVSVKIGRVILAVAKAEANAHICETCVAQIEAAFGAKNHVVVTSDSEAIKLFHDGFDRDREKEIAQQREAHGELSKQGVFVEFLTILRDGRANFSGKREGANSLETECTVHANAPNACMCGGWHDWRNMDALVVGNKAFGFGPTCARIAQNMGLNLPVKLDIAIASLLAERRGEDEHAKPSPKPLPVGAPRQTPRPHFVGTSAEPEYAGKRAGFDTAKKKKKGKKRLTKAEHAERMARASASPTPASDPKQKKGKGKAKTGDAKKANRQGKR